MSRPQQQPQQPKKRVAAPVAPQPRSVQQRPAAPAPQRDGRSSTPSIFANQAMIYTRQNYLIMMGGLGLITLGMFLMLGGAMPSPDVWDPNIIYSDRRITVAPMCMLAGFGVIAYGIFHRSKSAAVANTADTIMMSADEAAVSYKEAEA